MPYKVTVAAETAAGLGKKRETVFFSREYGISIRVC